MDNHKVNETSENRQHGMGAVLIRPGDTNPACSEIVAVEGVGESDKRDSP